MSAMVLTVRMSSAVFSAIVLHTYSFLFHSLSTVFAAQYSSGPLSSMCVVPNSVHSLGGQNVLLPITDVIF